MEVNEKIIDQYAVDTAWEQELAEQQEAEELERQIENSKEEYEEKQSDYDYLLSCLNLPFNTD